MADASILSNLSNPMALAGLALLLPIVLLYLLRPKPKTVLFPSTMFIRFIEKNKRFTSFLERFIRDPLLVMQLLIVSLIVLSVANPFYMMEEEERGSRSVAFVIDVSASMQSTDAQPTRFEQAVSKARQLIGQLGKDDEVTVVIASSVPTSVITRAKPQAAAGVLGRIEVQDTPSNIGDSILLAKDLILGADRKKVIYVISDFSKSAGIEVPIAKKLSELAGADVEFLKVGSRGYNAGITSLTAMRSPARREQLFLTASVKNYHPTDYAVDVKLTNGTEMWSEKRTLKPGAEEFLYMAPNISSAEQNIKLEIIGADDLPVDDVAYAHIPEDKTNNVLLMTSEGKDIYLRLMLDSLVSAKKIRLAYAVPPVIPQISEFDVIILGDVNGTNILPGTFDDIQSHVEDNGGLFIVVGSERLWSVGNQGMWYMMPVDMVSQSERESDVDVSMEHDILTDVTFENVVVKKYPNMAERDNQTTTLLKVKASGTPLMSYRGIGRGTVVYFGIDSDPERSNLYYSSDFPIFWNQMIDYFTRERASLSTRGYVTGEYLTLDSDMQITVPSEKTLRASSMYLDKTGVYKVSGAEGIVYVPVNLLNEMESNTSVADLEDLQSAQTYSVKYDKKEVKAELFRHILIMMAFAIVLEAIIYRRRGLL